MERALILDRYNTYLEWNLILTALEISPPTPKTNLVSIQGMSGTLDLSEALTGTITYNDRNLKASFWTDYGTRIDRENIYNQILNLIHGKKVSIVEPDDQEHFLQGRIEVGTQKNNLSYMEFTIAATCEPWKYAIRETNRIVDLNDDNGITIYNNGLKQICPMIIVEGGPITLEYGEDTVTLSSGSNIVTDLKLLHGENYIGLSGEGTVTFQFREAII